MEGDHDAASSFATVGGQAVVHGPNFSNITHRGEGTNRPPRRSGFRSATIAHTAVDDGRTVARQLDELTRRRGVVHWTAEGDEPRQVIVQWVHCRP